MNILGVHYGQSRNLLIFEIGMLLCYNCLFIPTMFLLILTTIVITIIIIIIITNI